jgi:hypothetical protein
MALDSYNCVLCNGSVEETSEHLFFQCPFPQNCWDFLHVHVPTQASTFDAMEHLRIGLQSPLFHESDYPPLLGNLDCKKRPYFSRNATISSWLSNHFQE